MLGAGEQLRELTITVEQLLDHGAKDVCEWDVLLHKGLRHSRDGSVCPVPEGW